MSIAEATYAQADRSLTGHQRAARGGPALGVRAAARPCRARLAAAERRPRPQQPRGRLPAAEAAARPAARPAAGAHRRSGRAGAVAAAAVCRAAGRGRVAGGRTRIRLAVTQVGNEVKVAEQAVAIARAERKPAISFRSDYGLVDYPESVPNFTDWRQNWTLGVGMSLPILDGGRIKANEAIARAGVDEARANLRLAAGARRARSRQHAVRSDGRPRRVGSQRQHDPAGAARLRDRRAALQRGPVDAARAVGRAAAAGAVAGDARRGRAQPAGAPHPLRAAAGAAAGRRQRQRRAERQQHDVTDAESHANRTSRGWCCRRRRRFGRTVSHGSVVDCLFTSCAAGRPRGGAGRRGLRQRRKPGGRQHGAGGRSTSAARTS